MVTESVSKVISMVTVPLKEELIHRGFEAIVMETPRKPLHLRSQPDGAEQLIDKDVFCIGRLPGCEVQLDINDPATKNINICIFNMPGSIIVVDGWSWPGLRLKVGGKMIPRRMTGSIFMVPHETVATLYMGKQQLVMCAAEDRTSITQMPLPE